MIERTETFFLKTNIGERTQQEFPEEVRILRESTNCKDVELKNGWRIELEWQFDLLYMKGVLKVLTAVLTLMENDKIVSVDARELQHGNACSKNCSA